MVGAGLLGFVGVGKASWVVGVVVGVVVGGSVMVETGWASKGSEWLGLGVGGKVGSCWEGIWHSWVYKARGGWEVVDSWV